MMINLNNHIMELNQHIFVNQRQIYSEEINGQEHTFHTFAVKNKKHRLDWYREEDVRTKLHLKDRHRSTLGRAAGNYFKKMFEPSAA